MFELWYIVIALVGSTFCGLWDLKTSDIPDNVCWLMIALGIGLHGLESYLIGSSLPIINSFIAGTAFLLFGLFMYYTGQWGGGDGGLHYSRGCPRQCSDGSGDGRESRHRNHRNDGASDGGIERTLRQ